MFETIQQLVAQGETEAALKILAQVTDDAILLSSRYNSGKRHHLTGQGSDADYQRSLNGIHYSILEVAKRHREKLEALPAPPAAANAKQPAPPPPASAVPIASGPTAAKPKVFISYNHADWANRDKIYKFLNEGGCDVTIDIKKMAAATKIQDFIIEQIKANSFVVSIVSKNSLKSGWVGMESNLALFSDLLGYGKFIPVVIDRDIFNPEPPKNPDDPEVDVYFDTHKAIQAKLKDLKKKKKLYEEQSVDTLPIEAEYRRNQKLLHSLPEIFEHLKTVLAIDVSDPADFESGMQNVLQTIKGEL